MSWRYQIVKHLRYGEEYYAIHDVCLDQHDKPNSAIKNPSGFGGGSREEVIRSLASALIDAILLPVVDAKDVGL